MKLQVHLKCVRDVPAPRSSSWRTTGRTPSPLLHQHQIWHVSVGARLQAWLLQKYRDLEKGFHHGDPSDRLRLPQCAIFQWTWFWQARYYAWRLIDNRLRQKSVFFSFLWTWLWQLWRVILQPYQVLAVALSGWMLWRVDRQVDNSSCVSMWQLCWPAYVEKLSYPLLVSSAPQWALVSSWGRCTCNMSQSHYATCACADLSYIVWVYKAEHSQGWVNSLLAHTLQMSPAKL